MQFNDAHAQIEQAKSYAVDGACYLGRVLEARARIWCLRLRLEGAMFGALRTTKTPEKLGGAKDPKDCRELLRIIERVMESYPTSSKVDSNDKPLGTTLLTYPC